ncbi:SPOR domain-containing protein [Flavobacteriales bacterium]|nr:SPOR domain-containing protein [Flavobacteriales bacterium]
MKKIILSFLVIALLTTGFSQDTSQNWKLYPGKTDTVLPTDTVFGIKHSLKKGTITVVKDSRIDKVSDAMRGGASNHPIITGYRVQIISSSTKSTVDSERGKFMSSYSGTKTYIDYKVPNFRLRVGNYRNKLEAQKFQNEIKKAFPYTLVISDSIDLPRLD